MLENNDKLQYICTCSKQKFSNIKNKIIQKLHKKNNMIDMCFDTTELDLLSKYKLK